MIKLNNKRYQAGVSLIDIFAEPDDHGLLDVKLKPRPSTPTDLLTQQFVEINTFFEQHGYPPAANAKSINEKKLARRLKKIRENEDLQQQLKDLDCYELLSVTGVIEVPKAELVTSLADIFADDDDGLLDFEDNSIFAINHVSYEKKDLPEDIAKRQPCADFARFEGIFKQAQKRLKAGELEAVRYQRELKVAQGDIFILYGVMCYVNSIDEALAQYKQFNARLHLIFENGTESNMLYQSLEAGLKRDKDGNKLLIDEMTFTPKPQTQTTGVIYIVSTLSKNPVLTAYKDLYKIGYTDLTVEQRVSNAQNDKTFLESAVRIVSTAQCYNFNPQRLETLVHGFLANQRLNIKLPAKDGSNYSPREWFNVPLLTAQSVIEYIINGNISQYRMDNTTGRIVKKN